MDYNIVVQTPPASEPVTVANLKAQLRLNTTAEDTLLAGFISAATQTFENLTGYCVVTQSLRQYVPYPRQTIYIMRTPVVSITDVYYADQTDTWVQDTSFMSDVNSRVANVYWTQSPPTCSRNINPKVYIDFTAGNDVANVPALIQQGITLLAAHFYQYREAYLDKLPLEMPMGFKSIVDQYQTGLRWSMPSAGRNHHWYSWLPMEGWY